jgi:phosphatidylinositol glycan class W
VGEYGVHWNFFFTLAAVSILTSTINVPAQYSGILGSLILVGILSFEYVCLNVCLWRVHFVTLSDFFIIQGTKFA